ncbi:Manganese transport system membrane protein MntB [Paenibacillus konkukensis]|uniref:Manganese transport system membrane protein MntB n=1 Tax=Paenibacillus konkukensis TaxID=2020716 RepID=A0ABY4RUJ9_9BACL|nr:metal ABC transporter permease [Paenibacillus konkukensis]UQZ86202.1 Manganese transport system membrane protein MntB [Paenibacillus konkukensis]
MANINWLELFLDPNTQWILLGSILLGLSSGVLGSFAYLRKQSLMGDALAHAALPGVCIAFMLTGSKSILFFLIGAAVSGIIATFGVGFVTRNSRIKQDSALGIVLSVFFGFGIVLLTQIQHGGSGNQSGLDKFLFGQAASMIHSDVVVMTIVALVLVAACALLFKEFKLLSFDSGFAKGLGYPVAFLEQLLMFLIVVAVVVGIQAVGVVLMSALLITPAVSARYWTERLGVMVALSGLFGAISGFAGTLASTTANNLPTGPLSVLAATALFAVSVVCAPRRGLLAKLLLRLSVRRAVLDEREPGTPLRRGQTAASLAAETQARKEGQA